MKNRITVTLLLILTSLMGFSQVIKKATFMVMPSTQWMTLNNYVTTIDNQGESVDVYNYKKAMSQDIDLLPVIAKIEGILKSRGLQTINMQAKLADLDIERSEDAMLTSKTSKSTVVESAYDRLVKRAKADYLVYITWNIVKSGPNRSVTFTMQAKDAYTLEDASSVSGNGKGSFDASLPVILEEVVLTHIDPFLAQVTEHVEDIFTNGRKVKFVVKKWPSWDGDLEKEFDGKELREIIEDWLRDNTVNGQYSSENSTENIIEFNNVRIPTLDANGKGLDANNFFRPLSKVLKEPPYLITNRMVVNGLGKVQIVLGEK